MGTWGAGVFESDSAWDMRDSFCNNLEIYIESCLYKIMRDAQDYFKTWSDESFLAALSMYHLLIIETNASPPQPNDVRHWRKEFFTGWKAIVSDDEMNADDKDYFEKRRLAVHNTFDSLIEMADNYHTSKHAPYIHTWKWQPVLIESRIPSSGIRFVFDQLNFLQLVIQSTLYHFENDADWWDNSYYDGQEVLAAVFMLRLLLEKCDDRPPEETLVKGWKKIYLTWFDSEFDDEGKQSEYYLKQLEVIKETFDDLIYLSRNWIPHHLRKPKLP